MNPVHELRKLVGYLLAKRTEVQDLDFKDIVSSTPPMVSRLKWSSTGSVDRGRSSVVSTECGGSIISSRRSDVIRLHEAWTVHLAP